MKTRTHCPNCHAQYAPHARTCAACGRTRDQISPAEEIATAQAAKAEQNKKVATVIAAVVGSILLLTQPAIAALTIAGFVLYYVATMSKRRPVPPLLWGAVAVSVVGMITAITAKAKPAPVVPVAVATPAPKATGIPLNQLPATFVTSDTKENKRDQQTAQRLENERQANAQLEAINAEREAQYNANGCTSTQSYNPNAPCYVARYEQATTGYVGGYAPSRGRSNAAYTQNVSGYNRKDGTHVNGYKRRRRK